MNWHDVGETDQLPKQAARAFLIDGIPIALVRTASDQYFAIENSCPHRSGPLSDGFVFGDNISCPLHGWNFSLVTGTAIFPDIGCIKTFPLEIKENRIRIAVENA